MPRDPPLVRIYGQAQFVNPGHGFFVLMEGGGSVWVQTSAPGKLAPGEFVDAVGRLERFDNRPLLTEACFRRAGPGTLAAPWLWSATNVTAEPDRSHGAAITVEGRLVEQQRSLNEDSLVLEDQGVIVSRTTGAAGERTPAGVGTRHATPTDWHLRGQATAPRREPAAHLRFSTLADFAGGRADSSATVVVDGAASSLVGWRHPVVGRAGVRLGRGATPTGGATNGGDWQSIGARSRGAGAGPASRASCMIRWGRNWSALPAA